MPPSFPSLRFFISINSLTNFYFFLLHAPPLSYFFLAPSSTPLLVYFFHHPIITALLLHPPSLVPLFSLFNGFSTTLIVNKQGIMRTRNTKKTGQTPPSKKGSKAPVKGESATHLSTATESVVATNEPEIKLEVQIQDINPDTLETDPEQKLAVSEIYGDGNNVVDTFPNDLSDKSKEHHTKPPKIASSPPGQKQKKAVLPIKTGGGASQTESKEPTTVQSEVEKAMEEPKEVFNKTTKDSDASEVTTVQTEVATVMEEVDVTGDENIAERDVEGEAKGEEEEEEAEGDEEEDGEGEENEVGMEKEVEEEDGNEEGDEEEEEEGGGGEEGDQVEGEREGHPALLAPRLTTERLKRKHFEVFVGGLDKESSEDDVKKAFEQVGEVVEVRLMKYSQSGKSKGYAFVRFATPDQATRATTELKTAEIKGKLCAIVPSEDNDVLFIGNVNKSWKKEQVEEKLKEYGIEGIEELIVMEDRKEEGMNRGFTFLEFGTHKDAMKAFKRLAKPDAIFGSERSAKVAWAYQNEPDEVAMSQVKPVFVDGVPTSWTEDKVKEHFGKYGEIERIVVSRKKPSSRQLDYAIINYATREASIACIDALKDVEIVDGEDKVKLKVSFTKPQLKGRSGKRIVHGGFTVGETARPGRGKGTPGRQNGSRTPNRGGGGSSRGGSCPLGRGKRTYKGPSGRTRALRQREAEDERHLHVDRSRGGPRRPARVLPPLRGGYSRREDVQRSRRQSLEYRSRHDDAPHFPPRGLYPESLPSRHIHSGRDPLPPPRSNDYLHRADRGVAYGHDVNTGFSRVRDYGEPGPAMKRSYSSLDDGYYESVSRGFPRARIDYDVPLLSSQYDSVRALAGRSSLSVGAGRASVSFAGGPVSQSSLGLYDQPDTLGGSSLCNTGGSSLYRVGGYISSGAESRGSALYGGRSSSGLYSYSGAGSGLYY